MNAKTSVIIICGEAIIYLSFYNLHDCTFKKWCEFIPFLHSLGNAGTESRKVI